MKRGTYLEINLKNFEDNLKNIIEYAKPKKFLPIIKANAYGMGAKAIIDILNKYTDCVCVAIVQEGLELKQNGYNGQIVVLDTCMNEEMEDAIDNDLILGVCSEKEITELNNIAKEKGKAIKIHLEIEAGLFRTGIKITDLQKFITLCGELDNICIDGVFAYFAGSETDEKYIKYQIETLKEASSVISNNNISLNYVHIANLDLTNNAEDTEHITAVRAGLVLYGHNQNDVCSNKVEIKPVSRLISCISFLKEIEKDESVGYSRKHISNKKEKIATVPVGYADGISRMLSNKGRVVINGTVCNIVGSVCMDSILVDVTNVENVKRGDVVYIWDNKNIFVEDIAKDSNTISQEIISRIAPRVERKYI